MNTDGMNTPQKPVLEYMKQNTSSHDTTTTNYQHNSMMTANLNNTLDTTVN
jgi:hypothetical protein